ncbi:type I pullulanase [Corynebacterium pelargi]|uniref:Pullulanase n=1 Tax=Corynebacterium pelargi TaxID=1471400 RepID=A0A410W9V4_9CORY|nr:type I pullulanase [Corynebacterium pelargi]QAU52732.1 Pullulanase [Corynebacterium pelargi]GGG78430.1 hypothetical protein GCM10007338_15610 [Corynebacterium pelargi]
MPSQPSWPGLYGFHLGAILNQGSTTFRVFAPQAHSVHLELISADSLSPGRYPAVASEYAGCFELTLEGELEHAVYLWRIDDQPSIDPYATASLVNAEASVVHRNAPVPRMPAFEGNPVIYEAHIRDLTIGADNGIAHKGKFLGLCESGTRTSSGQITGLDYLRSLGITHVQLLPIYDFGSVDERGDLGWNAQYNWGYDPVQYNVPEGSYATDPFDPTSRIDELKTMIRALHDAGLRVIMDVVYNHVYKVDESSLHHTAPGYYFRYRDGHLLNGTGVGNETASEQPMMRKLIVDSVMYWAEEYGIDGFRFDLMGIHDVDTMNAVREALDRIDPSILVLGEGWEMGHHPTGVLGANQRNSHLMPRIFHFNDRFRDAIKGSALHAHSSGVLSGARSEPLMRQLFQELSGRGLQQSVIYNEAHDNATMFDKFDATVPGVDPADREASLARRCMLATTLQFFAKGIVFIHAGQEMMRTKGGDENSYRSPDSVNAFDYERAARFEQYVRRFQRLCTLRQDYDPQRIDAVEITASHMVLNIDGRSLLIDVERLAMIDLEHPDIDVLL